MSNEKTIEQLENEIQKLREKNVQLLSEKKQVQAQRDEAKSQLDAVSAERDDLAEKYNYLTVELPRQDVLEQVAMPGASDMLYRELTHHFNIAKDEEGQDVFQDKEGNPLEVEGEPVPFTADGIKTLYESGVMQTIGHLLAGSRACGGGAGNTSASPTNIPRKEGSEVMRFGLK